MTENLEKIALDKKRVFDFVDLINGRKGKKPSFKIRTMRITRDEEKRLRDVWEKQKMQNDTAKMYPQLVRNLYGPKEKDQLCCFAKIRSWVTQYWAFSRQKYKIICRERL